MRIIDRYLLWQFLRTFLICYISLTGLYIVFDAFTNLEDFIRAADKRGGLAAMMLWHYAYRAVLFFDRTTGFLVLVSAMFTVSWLQRYNELTALMAAGISRVRVARPVMVSAILIILLAAFNREWVIPQCREELARRPQDLVGDVAQKVQPLYDNGSDILIRGKATYADRKRIEKPDFLLPPTLSDYGKLLTAENGYYCPPEGNRPGGYLLVGVDKPKDLAVRPSLMMGNRPVVISPRDAAGWLRPGQCFVVSDVTFDQLTGGTAWRQYSSTLDLIRSLHNPAFDFGADVRVSIHSRIVQPLLDITLLFLGLPLVLRRENRNVFLAMSLGGVIVSAFMMVVIGLQHLGAIYVLNPALAAWSPLMLFVPVAVGMSDAMWK
jgi:lipopolysaccharide export system permease protein